MDIGTELTQLIQTVHWVSSAIAVAEHVSSPKPQVKSRKLLHPGRQNTTIPIGIKKKKKKAEHLPDAHQHGKLPGVHQQTWHVTRGG